MILYSWICNLQINDFKLFFVRRVAMEAKLKAEAEVAEKKRKLEEEKSKALAVRTYVTEETQVLIVNDSAAQWSSFAKRIQGLSYSYV